MIEKKAHPRIVLSGIGQFGRIVAQLCEKKGWPIVAAFNRPGDKVGQPLVKIANLDKDSGVIIEDVDAYDGQALAADVVIITQTNVLSTNLSTYEKFLKAGLNVICLGTESYYPWSCNHGVAEQIDALAKQYGVTFTGSGIWDMSRVWSGIMMCGPCTEINKLTHRSLTNVRGQLDSKEQALLVLGIGLTVDEFNEQGFSKSNPVPLSYRTICEMVVTKLGYTITKSEAWIEPAVLDVPLYSDLLGRDIPAGDSVGTRIRSQLETREGLTAEAEIDLRFCLPDEVEEMVWDMQGLPSNQMTIKRANSQHASPAILVNRVPDVLAAKSGIVTIIDMSPIQHTALL